MICRLYNLKGQLVFESRTDTDTYQIGCNGLNKGLYILELVQGNKRYVVKIIR